MAERKCLKGMLSLYSRKLWNHVRVLFLTGWCTVPLVFCGLFFCYDQQGLDLLRRLITSSGWSAVFASGCFFFSVLCWSLATWYCSRLLLSRRFPHSQAYFFDDTKGLRTWWPRICGSLASFSIAIGFYRISHADLPYAFTTSLYYTLFSVLLLIGLRLRRDFIKAIKQKDPSFSDGRLPGVSFRALCVSFALCGVLLAVFLIAPVKPATAIGTPAILLLAAASWVLFGAIVLTYWPLAHSAAPLTLPLILWTFATSYCNDNHTIRIPAKKGKAVERQKLSDHFCQWLQERPGYATANEPYPVFVVAAAGGGIRAAYWTASVLGRIADQNPDTWADHVYALSGISGGSLGAAVHALQIAEHQQEILCKARHTFKKDFLSPVTAYLLFPDLVQRFLPFPVPSADRARALELSMETAVADSQGVNSDNFTKPFMNLWPKASHRAPALLLNSTVVETGQRAIVSNIAIDNDTFADAVDLLAVDNQTLPYMPLSTAVHLSARFTYVSPAGTIHDRTGNVWGHIVDGGYFENSGAATAVELIQHLAWTQSYTPLVTFILILIRNDPDSPSLCRPTRVKQPKPLAWLSDLYSPVLALLNTRNGRGRFAEKNATTVMENLYKTQDGKLEPLCPNCYIYEFNLGDNESTVEPPLGWSLSKKACAAMDKKIEQHEDRFSGICDWLGGKNRSKKLDCAAP